MDDVDCYKPGMTDIYSHTYCDRAEEVFSFFALVFRLKKSRTKIAFYVPLN